MKDRPRIADLFCGAGGAGMGLHRAGFEVVGFDTAPQKNYPFEFHQQDALETDLSGFDAVWASPPCQAYAITNNIWKKAHTYPDLVKPTRQKIKHLPYIIENVPGAPLLDPIMLCGEMFQLRVIRHRLFEMAQFVLAPPHLPHTSRASYGRTPKNGEHYTVSGHFGDVEGARKAMAIDWMTRQELAQAVPPAYSEYLGKQLLESIRRGELVDA